MMLNYLKISQHKETILDEVAEGKFKIDVSDHIIHLKSFIDKDTCKKIGIEILTQRRVSGILSELDLLGIITTNIISHGRYGRTKKIKIGNEFDAQIIREAFKEDQTLSNII